MKGSVEKCLVMHVHADISCCCLCGFKAQQWASGTVLRPFLQPDSPHSPQEFGLRLQVQASGFELTTLILEAARTNR